MIASETKGKQMAQTLPLPAQQTVTSLDTFEEVTIGKVGQFTSVENIQEALARVGGSHGELLNLVNQALMSKARQELKLDPTGWYVIPEGESVQSLDFNTAEQFSGSIGDKQKVNAAVLTFAKTVFGYNKDLSQADKAAAKDNAIFMIKDTPTIFAGIQKNCALTAPAAGESGTE